LQAQRRRTKNKEDVYFWREFQAVEDKQAAKIMAERETLAQRLSTAVSRAISEALANQPILVRIMISSYVFLVEQSTFYRLS